MRRHRVVLRFQHAEVPVCLPERPRHPDGRLAPQRGRLRRREFRRLRAVLQDVRDHDGHQPVLRLLLGGEVQQPVLQEALDVVQVSGGGREHGNVPGPAEPLVALRAVRGQVQEVPAQAPDDVAVQLVDEFVGAFEGADAFQVGMDHYGFEVIRRQGSGPAGDLGVTEAVECLGGFEGVLAAGQDEGVRGLRGAQRPDAQLAVLQHFGVLDGNGLSGLPAQSAPGPEPGSAQPAWRRRASMVGPS